MIEVMRWEWHFNAPLIAATGLPLSGVWQARLEGCRIGVYSSLIFCHIKSRGDGCGGTGGRGDAANLWFQRRRWAWLGLFLALVSYSKKNIVRGATESRVLRMS